jgi:glycosyltransferase involved in cell wall biosynthesis
MCCDCDGRHVSVVIPTLNEELTISRVVGDIKSLFPNAEVLVVDGHSTDGTRREALKAGAQVVLSEKKGYGEAVIRGAKFASRDIVVMVDGDATYDLSNLKELVCHASEGYVVVGCRFHSKPEGMDLASYFGNWVISKILTLVWGIRVADSQSGLKVFPRSLVSHFTQKDMSFSSEVLLRAKQKGLPIREVKIVDYRRRVSGSRSKLRKVPDGFTILKFILMERLTKSRRVQN